MMDQHAKLSITSDTYEETNKPSYQYEEVKCSTYSTTNNKQQNIMKEQSTSTWTERGVFFLTSLGFTTGLQGICLFPVLCDLNGGIVFVFCTMVLYLLLGIPVVLIETGLGQLSRLSPAVLFPKLCPLLSGLGFSMCCSSLVFSLSEACVLSWAVFYIYKSMECDLPWAHYHNYTPMASSAKYFTIEVLGASSDSEGFGQIQGHLVLGLAITWATVAACLGSGIRHTGKLCYVTIPVTFLFAGIVLVRGLFLWNGAISQAVSPQWNKITDLSVWLTAACYVFHSLNLGLGGFTAISSYNKHTTNVARDSMLVCFLHFLWGVGMWLTCVCLTAEYREGNYQLQTSAGPWVLFVLLARGLAALPHGIVFSMAVYIMVFFIGIGTLLGTILLISSTLLQYIPVLQNKRGYVTTGMCVVLFLLGIPLTSQAGLYLHLLISYSTIKWTLVLYSLCTCLAVIYCYGHKKFISHICSISNIQLQEVILTHLTVLYCTIIPAFLVMLLLYSFHSEARLPDGMASHPQLHSVSWIITSLPVMLIPLCAMLKFIRSRHKLTLLQCFKLLLTPDNTWIEYMSSRFQCSSSCEKMTMTTPIIVADTKDYSLVQSLHSSDGNNNLDEYVVTNALCKNYKDRSMF